MCRRANRRYAAKIVFCVVGLHQLSPLDAAPSTHRERLLVPRAQNVHQLLRHEVRALGRTVVAFRVFHCNENARYKYRYILKMLTKYLYLGANSIAQESENPTRFMYIHCRTPPRVYSKKIKINLYFIRNEF